MAFGLVLGEQVAEARHALVLALAAQHDVHEFRVGLGGQVAQILDPAVGVLAVAVGAVGGVERRALGHLVRGRLRRSAAGMAAAGGAGGSVTPLASSVKTRRRAGRKRERLRPPSVQPLDDGAVPARVDGDVLRAVDREGRRAR